MDDQEKKQEAGRPIRGVSATAEPIPDILMKNIKNCSRKNIKIPSKR